MPQETGHGLPSCRVVKAALLDWLLLCVFGGNIAFRTDDLDELRFLLPKFKESILDILHCGG